MLKFYLIGAAVTFCMMLFIFFKTSPWAEYDGQPNDERTTIGVILSCIIAIVLISSLSWFAAAVLFAKRAAEILQD